MLVLAPFHSAKFNSLRLLPCQSLFGALADKVALYFCRQSEGKGEDLALDVIAQTVVVLDGPYAALFRHADVENLHNHKEVAAETREFSADDEVVLLYFAEQLAKLPLGVCLGAADGFLYPTVNHEILSLAEVVDFETLVLHCLLVATYSDVSVYHAICCLV